MNRFFLDKHSVLSENPAITGSDVKHIRSVLRLKPGDTIALFDGEGTEYECAIMTSSPRHIGLSVLNSTRIVRESPVHITIAQALLKGPKMDWIIQKLTELGVSAFIPFPAKRSIPQLDADRSESRGHRWTKIACEALKQCGRSVAPDIGAIRSFDDMIRSEAQYDLKIMLCPALFPNISRGSLKESLDETPDAQRIVAVIGPEGGFTRKEIDAAAKRGYVPVSAGIRILRSETAAITSAAILQYVYGDLGYRPSHK
jgi:16S rRNA (uracil1498-N3)-methyltransferase